MNLYAYCGNDPVNYSDGSGHFPILALAIGIGIGAIFGGAFAGFSSYSEGNRGKALIGDILGAALIGGALGAASTIGGLFGAGMIGLKATGVAFTLSTIGSFGAGVGAYALEETWGRDKEWNAQNALISGAITSFESVINFTIGAAFSAGGLWNSMKNPQFMNDYSTLRVLGLGKCGSIFGASLKYFAENGVQMAARIAIKFGATYPFRMIRRFLNERY